MLSALGGLLLTIPTVEAAIVTVRAATDQQLVYSGRIQALEESDTDKSARGFRLSFLAGKKPDGAGRLMWLLEERAGGPRWSWAQRFGEVPLTASLEPAADRELPAIQGERDGSVRVVPLPLAYFGAPQPIRAGGQWGTKQEQFDVLGQEELAGRKCWRIGLTTKLGPKGVFWVEEQSSLLVRCRQIVFLGLGVPYELSLDLEKSEELPADAADRLAKAHAALVATRGTVKGTLSELPENAVPATAAFLEQVKGTAAQIRSELKSGQYVDLAQEIVRETETALHRDTDLAQLREQIVGKAAGDFALRTTRGDKVSLAELKGRPLVLHFWEYRSEPKIAPYGETGYLDFVRRQRQKDGVHILGIAVDPRLRDETARAAARQDIRSFCEFMNLSYPVAYDDGDKKVIDLFGDPRSVGGRLPLYVVIAPDGKVTEYHAGFWSGSADEGLKALDQQLRALVK